MIKNFKELITSVDVMNTLYGGISEPFMSLRENEKGREVRIRVPGIQKETLEVEVKNNILSVVYMIPVMSEGKELLIPQIVYKKTIPYFIKVSGISAVFANEELVVRLPFNKLANGYNKKIQIDEE